MTYQARLLAKKRTQNPWQNLKPALTLGSLKKSPLQG